MGVYVKGMEMPHDCGDCDFLSGLICPDNVYHCYAPVDNKNHSIDVTVFVENWQRPLWCPLHPMMTNGEAAVGMMEKMDAPYIQCTKNEAGQVEMLLDASWWDAESTRRSDDL